MKKKFIIPILVSVLMSSSVPVFAANFADINKVSWEGAKAYINDVADKNIMVGSYENGKNLFKPNDNLSYAEAAQICYTILKSTGNIDSSSYKTKWTAVMSGYKIPEWAYESVSYCLEKSIVTISDLSLFMSGTKSNFATRENVSKFIGKALSTLGYTSSGNVTLNDVSKISAEALPYVKLIAGLNIIVGDDYKNFNPKKLITRAEMAVVCSKSYDTLKENKAPSNPAAGSTAYGVVVSNEPFANSCILSVKTSTGTTLSFLTGPSIPMIYNGSPVAYDYLEKDDVVSLVYDGQTLKSLTLITDINGGGYSTFVSGTIETISETRVKLENQSGYYIFASSVGEITLDGKTSTVKDIISASGKYEISAKLLLDKDEKIVGITAEKDASEVYGEIEDIKGTRIKVGGETYYYADVEKLVVKIDGRSKDLDDLMDLFDDYSDDKKVLYATLKLDKDGDVETILALTEPKSDVPREIESISKSRIKLVDANKSYYFIDDEDYLVIKIDGSTKDLEDLIEVCEEDPDVVAVITLDKDDYVVRVDATTSDGGETKEGEIKSISKTSIKVGTRTYYYKDVDDLVVKIDNSTADLDDLIDEVDDGTVYATIYINNADEVTKIYAETDDSDEDFDISGELESISTSKLVVDGEDCDIDDEDDIDIDIEDGDDSITSYRDLKDAIDDGKVIDADVEVRNGYVYSIIGEVEEIKDAEIYDVYTSDREIRLQLSSGKYTYAVKSSADITLDGDDSNLTKLKSAIEDGEVIYADITFGIGGISVIDAEID